MLPERISSVAAVASSFAAAVVITTFALDRAPPAWAQTVTKPSASAAQIVSPQVATQACRAVAADTRLDHTLTHTAALLRAGEPIKIVAIGSSSTAGAGASSPGNAYPSRLEAELRARFPHVQITVVNRGVNGERANEMLARFDQDVLAEKPDLVVWQVGSNSVLHDDPVEPSTLRIQEGVARVKATGADIVLMNPQFAPKIITKHDVDGMVALIDMAAKASNVSVFHRFSVMRHWKQADGMEFSAFLSPDELHMNDWSYACIGKLLANSIAEAATRPAATAHALPSVR